MNGLLLLLCCIEILGAVVVQSTTETTTAEDSSNAYITVPANETTSLSNVTSAADKMSPTTATPSSYRAPTSPGVHGPTTTSNTTPFFMFYRKQCLPLFMVTGGLIIACTILLISTLLLMLKVCQLSRRIKMLRSDADLISTSDYWMGTANRNKRAPEKEAKETSVLMSDISQTQEDMGNGATKEEGGKVNEDGQKGEENKKGAGETAKSEEASTDPVTVAENATKTQEEATDSNSTNDAAASPSKGPEEPKDVV